MVGKIARPLFSYPTNQHECGDCLSAVKLGGWRRRWWGGGGVVLSSHWQNDASNGEVR